MNEEPTMALLSRELEEKIRKHAAKSYPFEACGALVGEMRGPVPHILEVHPAPNEEEDTRRRYRVSADFQLRLELATRAAGREVLGYYHSHPDHPVLPSAQDLAHAWQGYLYVICPVTMGKPGPVGAFVLDEDGAEFRPVVVRRSRAGLWRWLRWRQIPRRSTTDRKDGTARSGKAGQGPGRSS
jgi:proteasome lid subunit RPN8/RPN11